MDINACQAAYNAATYSAANLSAAAQAFRDLAQKELLSTLYVGGWIGYAGGDRRLCAGVVVRPLNELIVFRLSDQTPPNPCNEIYVTLRGALMPRPPADEHYVGVCTGIDAAYAGHVLQLQGLEMLAAANMSPRAAEKIMVPLLPAASQRSTGEWLNELCAFSTRCTMARELLERDAESQLLAAGIAAI